jgi:hypothetical protein
LLQELTTARNELAQWTLSPPATMKPEDVQRRLHAAETRVAELESNLAQESSQFAEMRQIGRANLEDIAVAMPAGSVLLDYAKFRDFNFKAKGKETAWGNLRYIVFATAAGKDPRPVTVDLGPAEPIDEAIADLRKIMGWAEKGELPRDDRQIREKLAAVRKLILDPALPHVRNSRHWIICPDGQIALVPFEALPFNDGKYLIELRKLSYLGAGREAVAYAGPLKETEKAKPALLVGDPDFDMGRDAQQAELQRIKIDGIAVALAEQPIRSFWKTIRAIEGSPTARLKEGN